MVRSGSSSGDGEARQPRILGDLEQTIAGSGPASERLVAAAQLHHAFSFDAVRDCDRRLDYEPRCSTSCADCRAIWIGSKAGEILRLRLTASELVRTKQSFDSGVRALVHVHRLGQLVAGLDLGHLVVLDDDEPALRLRGACHPARALDGGGELRLPYEPMVVLEDSVAADRFLHGITAMLELPADRDDPIVDLVVATRAPELLVVRLERDALTIRARHALPGWCRCLVTTGGAGDEVVVCVTRSGEILEWPCQALRHTPRDSPVRTHQTNLLPAAVARASGVRGDGHALFVGASDGLYIRRGSGEKPVHVAVTCSAVLSIATVTIPALRPDAPPRVYVALGLEDGRLRVIEEYALFEWLEGRDALGAHDFRVVLGDAVLALEILASDESTSRFVLAGLRDHRLRLFHVRSRESLLRDLRALWSEVLGDPKAITAPQVPAVLAAEHQLREPAGSRRDNALRYVLVDDVMPRWVRALGASDARIVERACAIAHGADDKVLYRLSATMGEIAGPDADALIRLSRACLVAMPQRDAQRWRAFVSYHLKRLHACARRPALRADRARLQHWGRFVRKYLLLGETFADKRFGIARLVQRNAQTHKHLDALIYAAQLERQRHDFAWSTVVQDAHGRPQDIARVDLIDDHAIVVVAAAEIVFFDVTGDDAGAPLTIRDAARSRTLDRLAPVRELRATGAIRTRATRLIRKEGSRVRIALSWEGENGVGSDPLRVTVFDVRLDPGGVTLESAHVVSHLRARRPGDPEVEVHGLVGLPGADAFLAGLDSSRSPLALIRRAATDGGGARWTLSALELGAGSPGTSSAGLATPVRAVAALALDTPGHYLGAAGGADGSLRLAAFDLEGNVLAVSEATLLVYPITDLALAVRHDDPDDSHVCYVGTATGESVCLLVRVEWATRTIVSTQLWRDLHGSAVIAVRPTTRPDPPPARLLYDEDVVFVATQNGRISIYHAGHGDPLTTRSSASLNYYFQGMRFDRIDLPEGLISWAIRRSRSGFLAAYPGGELRFGELHAPRESDLNAEMRQRTDEIYGKVMHAQLFFGVQGDEVEKLETCSMIRVGGGALKSYVLRKRLERQPWDRLTGDQIQALLAHELDGLSAEIDEERARIKVVIEMVSSRVLDRHPHEILESGRPGRAYDRIAAYPRVGQVCAWLARYLLESRVQSQPGAIRVRMSIVHALMRVNVFWHAALDGQSAGHIPGALQQVLTGCLRDDAMIVRVEALRAVAVALRNINVLLARASQSDRALLRALRRGFFPLGLQTLEWLMTTILDNYARYRRQGEPVLLSTPWSYIAVLTTVIRLFPGETLGLCEQLSQRGLGDSLDVICDVLRGRRVRPVCARIRELWIVPALRQPAQARAELIAAFGDCNIDERLTRYDIAPDDPDHRRASELLHVYRRLALFWKVNHETEIANDVPVRCHGWLPELTGSLAAMHQVLSTFVHVARMAPEDRVAKLRTQIAAALRDGPEPPAAVRGMLDRVVEHWQRILEPKVPTIGDRILGHTLGRVVAERGTGVVHAIEGHPHLVLKVPRSPLDQEARLDVNRDARLGRELAQRYPDSFLEVRELELTSGCAVMASSLVTRNVLAELERRAPGERARIARLAAMQLARALRCLHAEGLVHGDLCADNVFVHQVDGEPVFRLGDLRAVQSEAQDAMAAWRIPSFLQEAPDPGDAGPWIDLVSLTLFVHEVLTGEPWRRRQHSHARDHLMRALERCGDRGDVAQAIARMLGDAPCRTAEELEHAFPSELPAFERRPLAGRVRARFDVFISYDFDDVAVAQQLDVELTRRGLVPYFDHREPVQPANWVNVLREAMDSSRAFAILVGDNYRDYRFQRGEVEAARSVADAERLPLKFFLLGQGCPRAFRGDAAIPVGRDPKTIADHVLRSFEHPIDRPR